MYIDIKNEKIIGIYADNGREGLIDVGIIPSPEEIPGKIPVMYYRNGAIVYEYEDAPEATDNGTETSPVPNGLRRNGKRIDPSEIYLVGGVGDTSAKRYESRGVRGL